MEQQVSLSLSLSPSHFTPLSLSKSILKKKHLNRNPHEKDGKGEMHTELSPGKVSSYQHVGKQALFPGCHVTAKQLHPLRSSQNFFI